jgi:hypothetical protein
VRPDRPVSRPLNSTFRSAPTATRTRDLLLRRSLACAWRACPPQLGCRVGLAASDREFPRFTARSGTQRARAYLGEHLIRRSGHIVQDRPSPVVGWADIPELSTCVGCRPAAWLQSWLQSPRNGTDDLRPSSGPSPGEAAPSCPVQTPPPNPIAAEPGDGRVRSRSSSRVHEPRTFSDLVALRSQTALTGPGRHVPSYGGFGGGHPHFHLHVSGESPNLGHHPLPRRETNEVSLEDAASPVCYGCSRRWFVRNPNRAFSHNRLCSRSWP